MAATNSTPTQGQGRQYPSTEAQTSDSTPSSANTTPSQTPYQELSQSIFEIPSTTGSPPPSSSPPPPASSSSPTQSRGRPRQKRRQPSKRYFTPPSRLPSPVRPDFTLDVETVPQEPDIFADPETDYFSSAEKPEPPRAFRRHFFDAMPSMDGPVSGDRMVGQSIDARLAAN